MKNYQYIAKFNFFIVIYNIQVDNISFYSWNFRFIDSQILEAYGKMFIL